LPAASSVSASESSRPTVITTTLDGRPGHQPQATRPL